MIEITVGVDLNLVAKDELENWVAANTIAALGDGQVAYLVGCVREYLSWSATAAEVNMRVQPAIIGKPFELVDDIS